MGSSRGHRRSLAGTVLLAVGLLGLLGGSFGLGVLVGRHWSYFSTLTARKPPADSRREAGEARGVDKSRRPPETIPRLTFYQELTAPLTSPPVQAAAPSPVRPSPPSPAQSAAPPPLESSAAPPPSVRPALPPEKGVAGGEKQAGTGPFTVQLAAYKVRSQAEALREALAARGIEAHVSEALTPSGTRYRVRVGPFEDKEDARQKAVTLATDTRLGAFVTNDGALR